MTPRAMRVVITSLLALLLSMLAAAGVAASLSDWARSGEAYILAFIAIAPAVIIACAVFLVAGSRGHDTVTRAAFVLLCMTGALYVPLAASSYLGAPSASLAVRELKLTTVIATVAATVVAVQWLVFRWRV
jgi:hypothetical protein